jgi:hypothetical protein
VSLDEHASLTDEFTEYVSGNENLSTEKNSEISFNDLMNSHKKPSVHNQHWVHLTILIPTPKTTSCTKLNTFLPSSTTLLFKALPFNEILHLYFIVLFSPPFNQSFFSPLIELHSITSAKNPSSAA